MNQERKYYVSYAHPTGFGCTNITVKGRLSLIRAQEDIAKDTGLKRNDVVILFFTELDPEKVQT